MTGAIKPRWMDRTTKWGIEWDIVTDSRRGGVVQRVDGVFLWTVEARPGWYPFVLKGESATVEEAMARVKALLEDAPDGVPMGVPDVPVYLQGEHHRVTLKWGWWRCHYGAELRGEEAFLDHRSQFAAAGGN